MPVIYGCLKKIFAAVLPALSSRLRQWPPLLGQAILSIQQAIISRLLRKKLPMPFLLRPLQALAFPFSWVAAPLPLPATLHFLIQAF